MHKIFLILILPFFSFFGYGQGIQEDLNDYRKPCFQKSLDRIGKRYVEWECGQDPVILNCNENLELDPDLNVVFNRENGKLFTGTCETCHINGLRQHFAHFVNGKPEGTDTTYYASGCPQVVRSFVGGLETGTWTYYNDTSGLMAWQINYLNGQKQGVSVYYNQKPVGKSQASYTVNGVEKHINYTIFENDTAKVEHYNNGLLTGIKKEYWPNSKIKREVAYTEGVLNGKFMAYDEEGNVLEELFYKNGIKDGVWKYYYNNGNILKVENWKKGVLDGEVKTFYIQGSIQTIGVYKKGMKHGRFVERDYENRLRREAIYEKDELIEEHVFNEYGEEIKTVGGDEKDKMEDDKIPNADKKKKRSKRKERKKTKK